VEWTIPGKNVLYATSMPRRSGAMPLVATTTEGRPIKLEGNSLHPLSSGGTDTIAQCSLLDLYDPDRSRYFLENGKPVDVARFAQFMAETRLALQKTGGAGAAILVEETFSPTRDRLRTALAKEFPQLLWCVYDPLRPFNEVEATRAAFGDGVRLTPRYDRADVVLSLDCDFLHVDEGGLAATRDFSNKRRVAQATDPMNRLYVVENRYTITGGKADHRLRLQASQIGAFAVALGHKVAAMAGGAGGALTGLLGAFPADLATRFAAQDAWLTEAARDLLANPGRSLVVVGRRQPGAVHLLAQAINGVLGNVGHTLVAHAAEARESGLRRAGQPRLGGEAKERADRGAARILRRRDERVRALARADGALPRAMGRHAYGGRHLLRDPADDPAAVRRPERSAGHERAARPADAR
jgi:molybdopterin-containing oxidoreductase family iron-sulfur binding subunit